MNFLKHFIPLTLVCCINSVFAQNMPLVTITFQDPEQLCVANDGQSGFNGLPLLFSYVMADNANPNHLYSRTSQTPVLTNGDSYTINPRSNYSYISFNISGKAQNCGKLEYVSTNGNCERNLSEEFPKNTATITVTPKKAPLAFDPDGGYTLDCVVSGS